MEVEEKGEAVHLHQIKETMTGAAAQTMASVAEVVAVMMASVAEVVAVTMASVAEVVAVMMASVAETMTPTPAVEMVTSVVDAVVEAPRPNKRS